MDHLVVVDKWDTESVKRLVQTNSGVNKRDREGRTPLLWAIGRGSEATVKLLLAQDGIDLNAKDNSGRTSLYEAVVNGSEAILALLLAQDGVDLNAKDHNGRTPLFCAVDLGKEAMVKLLLAQDGVDINARDNDGRTPLYAAVTNGNEATIKLLLAPDGVDVNAKDNYGLTPLQLAVQKKAESIVVLLLARNLDPNNQGNVRGTALPYGSHINKSPWQTLLSRAAASGEVDMVELLLAQGNIDPDVKDNGGCTPLWRALEKGHMSVVNLLIPKDHGTLHMLVRLEKWDLVWRLLNAGYKNIDACDTSGMTLIQLAIQKKQGRLIRELLECKARTEGIMAREWCNALGNTAAGIVQVSKDGNGVSRLRFPTADDLSQTTATARISLFVVMDSSLWEKVPIVNLGAGLPNILETSLLPERNGPAVNVSISLRFPHAEHSITEHHVSEGGECKIAWKIIPPVDLNKGPWRPIVYFSMLPYGWIPEDDLGFLEQFITYLKRRWLRMCSQVEKVLNLRRLDQLRSEGKNPNLMRQFAEETQKLAELHGILERQVREANKFITNYYRLFHPNQAPDLKPLDEFEHSVNDQIRKLDQIASDLLQTESTWASIVGTRISTKLAQNGMLLTYINIFYLPLGFCAALWAIPNITDSATRNPFIITTVLAGLATLAVAFNVNYIIGSAGRVSQWWSQKIRGGAKPPDAKSHQIPLA